MGLPIGLQSYTVREALAQDLDTAMHAVAEIGYKYVEHIDAFDYSTEKFAGLCEKLGIKIISSHVGIEKLEDEAELDRLLGEAGDYGFKHLVCSHIPPNERSEEDYLRFPVRFNKAARLMADIGVKLSFHNHAYEFKDMVRGKRLWEHLLDTFDSGCTYFELDVAWLDFGGEDAAGWIKKLAGRAPLIHIKDHVGPDDGTGRATFTEVGTGVVDIKGVVGAAEGCGAEYLVIEQDRYWIDDDSVKSAKISYDNLRGIVGG